MDEEKEVSTSRSIEFGKTKLKRIKPEIVFEIHDPNEKLEAWLEEVVAKGTFKTREDAMKVMAGLGVEFAEHFGITRDVFNQKCLPLTIETFVIDPEHPEMSTDIFNKDVMDRLLDKITAGVWSSKLKGDHSILGL